MNTAKSKRNTRVILVIFIAMFVVLSLYLAYSVTMYGSVYFSNPHNSRLTAAKKTIIPGDVLDRKGAKLATSDEDGNRIYQSSADARKASASVVGDQRGMSSSGAESFMASELLGFDQGVWDRLSDLLAGRKKRGNDVALTVDAALNNTIYDAVKKYEGAAVVVQNYKTGEILGSVSTPAFDPENLEEYIPQKDDSESVQAQKNKAGYFVNRVTKGKYTPGSVFKIVTTLAMLEAFPDANARTYTCSGSYKVDDRTIVDAGRATHGKETLAEAFKHSCNISYAQMGLELGAGPIDAMATKLGFGEAFLFDDISVSSSSYVSPSKKSDLAWSSVGQYKDIMTPMHMNMITAAIANGGTMMVPKLCLKTINTRGEETRQLSPEVFKTPITAEQAAALEGYMVETVKSGTGTSAAIKGVTVAGKTGSAEVSENKETATHAWFTGYIVDDSHPLAITVIIEKGGSGGGVAAPIAKTALAKAMELGY
ncbi:beta-lactamase [Bacteroidia bacterium]|nr:beta-lactamase [Bacteroidia bacterium]